MRILIFPLLLTLLATSAPAAPLLFEGFNYTVGQNLSNQVNAASGNTWLRPSAPTGATQIIAAGDVNYPGLLATPASNSLSVPRPPSGTTVQNRLNVPGRPYSRAPGTTLYFSFVMEMTSFTTFAPPGGNPSDTKNDAAAKNATHRKGGWIAGLHGGAASTSTAMSATNGFAAPIFVRRDLDYTVLGTDGTLGTQTGRYEIGILKQASTPATSAEQEAAFNIAGSFGVGDEVFVVGQYQFVDAAAGGFGDIARLWINPTPGVPLGVLTPTLVAPATLPNMGGTLALESFHVRGDTNSPGNFLLDNIRVGLTYRDVVVPEPAALALLGIGVAIVGLRRRLR